jgi:hypothetical protein
VLPHIAPGVVFICPAFWSMAPSGFESMTDTLIHEVAHFYETYDIARDLQPSLDLAANNPGAAAFNADNYAYYSVDR